jgi:hypothetical protein
VFQAGDLAVALSLIEVSLHSVYDFRQKFVSAAAVAFVICEKSTIPAFLQTSDVTLYTVIGDVKAITDINLPAKPLQDKLRGYEPETPVVTFQM